MSNVDVPIGLNLNSIEEPDDSQDHRCELHRAIEGEANVRSSELAHIRQVRGQSCSKYGTQSVDANGNPPVQVIVGASEPDVAIDSFV